MKLSAEYWSQSSMEVTLSSKFGVAVFIPYLNLLQREDPLIHVFHDQPSELVCTLILRFQSVVGRKLKYSCCSLDLNNTDNELFYDLAVLHTLMLKEDQVMH